MRFISGVTVMIHPVIMIVLRPAVAMLNSGLVTTREAVAVLVAVHAVRRRMAKHHRVVRVQRLTRLPVIVSSIHAVVKSAAIDVEKFVALEVTAHRWPCW